MTNVFDLELAGRLYMYEQYINLMIALSYIGILLYVIFSDMCRMVIPNWCSIALMVLFIIYAYFFHSISNVGWHFLIGVSVLIAGYGLYLLNWFGAGDVKLMSVVMLWSGAGYALKFLIVTVIIGGLLAFIILILQKIINFFPQLLFGPRIVRVPASWALSGSIPYGIAIGISALIVARDLFFPELQLAFLR